MELWPESALVADTTKQRYSVYPRKYYVDVRRTCRDCGRPFIFFALEQRYWFEELGFWVDADCIRCTDCRRALHHTRAHYGRFSDLIRAPPTES